MPDAYDENVGLTDSYCNVGKEGIYSCISLNPMYKQALLACLYEIQRELLFSLFPTSLMFNSCPTRIQTTMYMFHSYLNMS